MGERKAVAQKVLNWGTEGKDREGGAVQEQSGEKGHRSDGRLYSVSSPNAAFSIAVFCALPRAWDRSVNLSGAFI